MSILTSQIKEVLNGAIAELKLSGEVIVEKAKIMSMVILQLIFP
jgi:hypothetical protein